MKININVEGADNIAERLRDKSSNLYKNVSNAIARGGQLISGQARELAPVAPINGGTLKGSIESHAKGLRAEIGTNVEYAIYQEFGTYKMDAQPFLLPSLDVLKDDVAEMIAEAVRNS